MKEKISILLDILGNYHVSNEEHLFGCPYCGHHKHKFSVNIEKNVYKCWICDARGKNLYRLVRKFGSFQQQEKWKELTGECQDLSDFDTIFQTEQPSQEVEAIIELPLGFDTLTRKSNSKSHNRALQYLASRGIEHSDILRWKIGYTTKYPFQDRIIIPSFNNSGDLNYFIARSFSGDPYRYKNPKVSRNIIFNELYVDFEKEIMLVEGVFDAMKAQNAVPILGSTIRETSKLFRKIVKHDTPVLLALDADARRKSQSIKRLFLKYGIEVREVEYSDDRDIGDMSKQEVQTLSKDAPIVREKDNLIDAITAL